MFGGVGVLLVVGAPALARTSLAAVTPGAWGAVVYSGIVALVIAYMFYYRGVRVLGPTRTAMFANLQPLIALAVAYLTLGEAPTAVQLGGAAAIMVGLLVSRR
jgi:drug/metabolite transporter (DMT)-like permease